MKRRIIKFVGILMILTCLVSLIGCQSGPEPFTPTAGTTAPATSETTLQQTTTEPDETTTEETTTEEETSAETTTKATTTKKVTTTAGTTLAKPSSNPYLIKVNRKQNCVTVYKKDSDGAYTVPVKAMVCSTSEDGVTTPLGTYNTINKYTWRALVGNVYGQYATRIVGHILFHSVPYYKQDPATLETEEFNKLGTAASAGCIRLCVADAKWIYDNCPLGTTVEIYDSSDPGPLGKPTMQKIDLNSPNKGWDPTDPNHKNPWNK